MHTIQQQEAAEQPRKKRTASAPGTVQVFFHAPRELRTRLNVIAAKSEKRFNALCIDALERYAAEKERELGLPRQQGAA